jgi:uncharacterized protein YgiM (DUF1202 family)
VREQQKAVPRAAALLAGLLLAGFTLLVNAPAARAEGTGSAIADAALARLGTHGGQCWTFMQTVVAEATGAHVGSAYRDGYFAAGAVEVSSAEATAGDIIQISSDEAPSSYFPGVHTAIVLENLGGGLFNAIDSNQNWDEWVSLRPGYDPFAAAARYGLSVHFYRFAGGSSSSATLASVPGAPSVSSGDSARVATTGDCLNLREGPSLSSSRMGCLRNGTAVSIAGETVAADGYSWVPVDTPLGSGWVAANYLSAATAVAAVEPEPEPEAAVAAQPEAPAGTADDAGAASAEYPVNWIHVDNSPGCLRLRTAAGMDSGIVDCLSAGTAVTLVSDVSIAANGFVWVNVRTEHGDYGWVASEHLVP